MAKVQALVILFLILKFCTAFDVPRNNCRSDLYIDNNHYNLSNSYDIGDTNPTDTHYDKFGNLFFVVTGRNDKGYFYNAYMIKFESTVPEKIPGLPEGTSYSVAVDKKHTKVFFGTAHGIYRYDYKKHSAALASKSSLKLDMIFIDTDGNKYVTEPKDGFQELYLLKGEKKIRFHSLDALNELTIDDGNNFYYIKEERLFVLKANASTPICMGNLSYDGISQIAVHNDNVFVASDDLLYIHQNETGNLRTVNNTPENVTSIAFDDKTGDFVLGAPKKIFNYKKIECNLRKNDVDN